MSLEPDNLEPTMPPANQAAEHDAEDWPTSQESSDFFLDGQEPAPPSKPPIALEARLSAQEWLDVARMRPASRALSYGGLALGLGMAIVLLLVCAFSVPFLASPSTHATAAAAQPQRTMVAVATATTTPTDRLDFATQAPDPTPLPYVYATPTFEATANATPQDSPTPFSPGDPPPTVSPPGPPPTGNSAILLVAPPTLNVACQTRQGRGNFTIFNVGGAPLTWNVQADGFDVAQQSGSLDPGSRTNIMVRGITRAGQIVVRADNATNSPQIVSIVCI